MPRAIHVGVVCILFAAGCAGAPPPVLGVRLATVQRAAPLAHGQYVARDALEPSLLGRRLAARYDAAVPLREQLSDNPCLAHLVAGDAADTTARAQGFESDVYYDLTVRGGLERRPTEAYAACCREHDCGVGYLRELAHGAGTLTPARWTDAGGSSDVALEQETSGVIEELTFGGPARSVRGWVAVRIEGVTPIAAADASDAAIVVRAKDNGLGFTYCTAAEQCITENEFPRRYEKVTHSRVLHDYLRPRHAPRAYGWLTGAGAVALAAGATTLLAVAPPQADRDFAAGILIGTSVLLTAQTVLFALEPYDGLDSRLLTLAQARLFAQRYNRALKTPPSPSPSAR